MGQVGGKLCDQCSYCLIFLNLSRKKSLQYLELEDFGITAKEENKEICEEPKITDDKATFLVDSSDFLNFYLEPPDYNCDKILEKDGITVFGQAFDEGFLVKAYWNSKFSPEDLYTYFRNSDQRKLWDKNIEILEEVPIPDSQEFYTYMKFKKVVAISQRDSVIISRKIEKNDGVVLVSKSCVHEKYPETENVTRMKIYVAGYYFKSIEDGEFKSKIFSCTRANFGGAISHKFILKATAMALPPLYKTMEKCMENYYKANR
jgi:hypothetical protein